MSELHGSHVSSAHGSCFFASCPEWFPYQIRYFADINVTVENLEDIAIYNGHSSLAEVWSPSLMNGNVTYSWAGPPTGLPGARNVMMKFEAGQGGSLGYWIFADYKEYQTLVFSYYGISIYFACCNAC